MSYFLVGVVFIVLLGCAIHFHSKWRDLKTESDHERHDFEDRIGGLEDELDRSRSLIESLEKYKRIPGVLEKVERSDRAARERLQNAELQAKEMIRVAEENATKLAELRSFQAKAELSRIESLLSTSRSEYDAIIESARIQAHEAIEQARSESKAILREARSEASEKTKKADELLRLANEYVRDMRQKADLEASIIAGKAYEALKRYEFYSQARKALRIEVDRYLVDHMFESTSILDDWSLEFGFHEAGQMLKFARKRTRKLIDQDMAGESGYPEPMKRQFAIHFLLDAFDGKVESLISRSKADNFQKLKEELVDAFVLINANGRAFERTRITEEYKDSRVDELKWACVIQKIRARNRDEQKAIKDRIRDEERAKKEYERALKQAKREEEILEKALSKARAQFETAAEKDRAAYLEKIGELEAKLIETEGYIKRTQSLAELTRQGHVYVISNIGSFGEDIYKIGLTRRLNPEDRINELGDASVPFRFDVHACIWSDDAPALEYALHKAFIDNQLNKMTRLSHF